MAATSSKIKFDDSDEEEEMEDDLADATFEERLRAMSDGSVNRKPKPGNKPGGGRANKNRPMEMSSKKPVSRFREVIQVPKKVGCDPRFESLSGKLDVDGFKKRYKFLYENELPAEKEMLMKQLKESNDPQVTEELKSRIAWISQQLKSAAAPKVTEKEILAQHKKKEREAAKQGKRPYYLKKSEIRKRQQTEKYKELKESGKLESYVEKKRKKNASKDHRYVPYRRSRGEQ